MMKNRSARGFLDTRITIAGFLILLLLIGGFALSRSYNLLQGPHIVVNEEIEEGFVTLSGRVYRTARFSINGRTVAPEQNGNFSERLFLSPGHTIMRLEARDRFDRTTTEIIPIYIPIHASEETNQNNEEASESGAETGE